MARFTATGQTVTVIYLTRGEAGIPGKSHGEAADIRTREALEACKILRPKPVFAGQIDGNTIMNNEWVRKLQSMPEEENPDIVFTHWPIDSHNDHQIASLLTIKCSMRAEKKAVYAHVSQDPPGIYQCGHAAMEEFRGRGRGSVAAEAFVRMTGLRNGNQFIC